MVTKNSRAKKYTLGVLVVLLVALILFLGMNNLAFAQKNDRTKTDSSTVYELQWIWKHLTGGKVSDEGKEILLENLEIAQARATLEAGRYSNEPKPTRQGPNPPDSITDLPRVEGIIYDGPSPFSSSVVIVTNVWQRKVFEEYVQVVAGVLPEDRQQGVVIVLSESPRINSGWFLTPTKAGKVTITAENNFRLTLVADTGEIFYFDVGSLSYVSSLTETVPTTTPLPPSNPYP